MKELIETIFAVAFVAIVVIIVKFFARRRKKREQKFIEQHAHLIGIEGYLDLWGDKAFSDKDGKLFSELRDMLPIISMSRDSIHSHYMHCKIVRVYSEYGDIIYRLNPILDRIYDFKVVYKDEKMTILESDELGELHLATKECDNYEIEMVVSMKWEIIPVSLTLRRINLIEVKK